MGPGGAQQQMLRLAQSLAVAGVTPAVHWYNQSSAFHQLPPGIQGGVLPKRSPTDPRFWRALQRATQTADVVHAWLPYPGLYAGLAGLGLGAAAVLHGVRCAPQLFDGQPAQLRATLAAAAMSRAVTANATTMVDWLIARGIAPQRVFHLPNQLDPALLERPPATPEDKHATLVGLGLDPARPPITCLGRFDRNKNQIGLLRALGRVQATDRGRSLPPVVLAGEVQDPAVGAEVQSLIVQFGLDARVLRPVADPAALLAASRVSVLASLSEGSPNVVLEGLAVGTVTVSTQVGEVPSLVRDGDTGLTCTAGDDAALAACMQRALSLDPQSAQQMGERARLDVRARFGALPIARRYLALYETVVAERWARIGPRRGFLRSYTGSR